MYLSLFCISVFGRLYLRFPSKVYTQSKIFQPFNGNLYEKIQVNCVINYQHFNGRFLVTFRVLKLFNQSIMFVAWNVRKSFWAFWRCLQWRAYRVLEMQVRKFFWGSLSLQRHGTENFDNIMMIIIVGNINRLFEMSGTCNNYINSKRAIICKFIFLFLHCD